MCSVNLRTGRNFWRFHDRFPRFEIRSPEGHPDDGGAGLDRLGVDRFLEKPLHDPHWKVSIRVFGRGIFTINSSKT